MEKAREFASLLSREYLVRKLNKELGEGFFEPSETPPACGLAGIKKMPLPLGTLFHISAGNMDALPAYTVVEGLLTGNVNILKLPQADNGLTVAALSKLIETEPSLAEYVYVFDTPSSDIAAMRRLSEMADGVVVWGGDAAVSAVRAMAPTGAKLIEWGHRLSFAYISGDWTKKKEELAGRKTETEAREALLNDPNVRRVMDMMEHCDIVLTGLGGIDVSRLKTAEIIREYQTEAQAQELKEKGAVGCVCMMYYDINGNYVPCEWNEKCICLHLDKVRKNQMTVAVACGDHKIMTILGALRGHLPNVLITDVNTAAKVLSRNEELFGKSPEA